MSENTTFVNRAPENGVISGNNAESSSLSAPADDEILNDIEALVKQAKLSPSQQQRVGQQCASVDSDMLDKALEVYDAATTKNDRIDAKREIFSILAKINDAAELSEAKSEVTSRLKIGVREFNSLLAGAREAAQGSQSVVSEYAVRDGVLHTVFAEELVPIATFNAWIGAEIVDETGEVSYRVDGTASRGADFSVTIDTATFSHSQKLKAALEAAAGPLDTVHAKMESHLGPAIKLLTPGPVERIKRFDRTGWGDDGFMIPGRNQGGRDICLPEKLPYSPAPISDLQGAISALGTLMESLPPTHSPVVLGAILGAPLARLMGLHDERYAVFLRGETGTYKTTTAQSFMTVYGKGFLEDANLIQWGKSTQNAIMRFATSAHDVPFLIDNYKSNTGGGPGAFVSMIHAIMEGSEKDRMRSNAELIATRTISCWPICTGEDLPSSDAAMLARMLIIPLQKRTPPQISDDLRVQQSLAQIGTLWLDWLESDEGQIAAEVARQRFVRERRAWGDKIQKEYPTMANPHRTASALAMNQACFAAAAKHPDLGAVLEPYLSTHAVGLGSILQGMVTASSESLEGVRFVSAIREMLSSGAAALYQSREHYEDTHSSVRDRFIGWATGDGGAYLFPSQTFARIQKIVGEDFGGMSKGAIYNQLKGRGWIQPGSDQATITSRVSGKPERYLYILPAALGEAACDD